MRYSGSLRSVDVGRLLRIEDPSDWGGGLAVRSDGVFRREFDRDSDRQIWRLLSPEERAAIGDPDECILALPCTLDQLEAFVDTEGLRDAYTDRRLRLLRAFAREPRGASGVAQVASGLATVRDRENDVTPTGRVDVREMPAERRARRLARLRELGGDFEVAGTGCRTTGDRGALARLVSEEQAAGRPMSDKSVGAD